ncbi:MAG: cobalt transport protein [Ruminococcus sp.]|nr:cobalt transport protein [Ruminococcus sp.]
MRSFSEYNPVVITVYIFSVTGIAMFCNYPLLIGMTFLGGLLYYIVRNGRSHWRSHIFFFMLFIVLAAANPLVSHNGVTILFVMNDNPVTLEALLYGINSAAMIVGVLYWFRNFTQIMTSEKLLYVTGALSPKLSLVLSMSLRFVPMFHRQSENVSDAQKAMGLFKEDNVIDDVRGKMRIFSIIITWALENGIITADSMAARGFGTGKRSHFTNFRFRRGDIIFLLTDLALLGICVAAIAGHFLELDFYPKIKGSEIGAEAIAGAAAYGLLVLLPVIIETEASLRWRYLKSKI